MTGGERDRCTSTRNDPRCRPFVCQKVNENSTVATTYTGCQLKLHGCDTLTIDLFVFVPVG